MLVEVPRIARHQTRLVDLAKWDASDSMASHVALSGLLNALGSVDAQAGGPLTDHQDEGQAIRTSGQRRSSSGRTRTAAMVLHRATLILPHPGVSPSPSTPPSPPSTASCADSESSGAYFGIAHESLGPRTRLLRMVRCTRLDPRVSTTRAAGLPCHDMQDASARTGGRTRSGGRIEAVHLPADPISSSSYERLSSSVLHAQR